MLLKRQLQLTAFVSPQNRIFLLFLLFPVLLYPISQFFNVFGCSRNFLRLVYMPLTRTRHYQRLFKTLLLILLYKFLHLRPQLLNTLQLHLLTILMHRVFLTISALLIRARHTLYDQGLWVLF